MGAAHPPRSTLRVSTRFDASSKIPIRATVWGMQDRERSHRGIARSSFWARLGWLIGLTPLLVLAPNTSPHPEEFDPQEGHLAERGRWTVTGGNASGSSATKTPPLRGPIEVSWRTKLKGDVHGDPLVWDDRVLVELDMGKKKRALVTLDLETGEELDISYYKSEQPLGPSIWRDQVAFRSGPDKIEIKRWSREGIGKGYGHRVEAPAGPPLLYGSELYITSGDGLTRLDRSRREVWTTQGDYRGRPRLRGDKVYAIREGTSGAFDVVAIDRESGDAGNDSLMGSTKSDLSDADIAVMHHYISVHPTGPITAIGSGAMPARATLRPIFKDNLRRNGYIPRNLLLGFPVEHGEGYIARGMNVRTILSSEDLENRTTSFEEGSAAARVPCLISVDPTYSWALNAADDQYHVNFARYEGHPSVARNVLFHANAAVDLSTMRILWQTDLNATQRMVPAEGHVLVVHDGSELCALGRPRPVQDEAERFDLDQGGAFEGVAVLAGGKVLEASFTVDIEGDRLAENLGDGKTKGHGLGEVWWLEQTNGTVVYAPSAKAGVKAVGRLADAESGKVALELAQAAEDSRDPELMFEMSDWAISLGIPESKLKKVVKTAEGFSKRPKPIDSKVVDEVRGRTQEVSDAAAAVIWDRIANLAGEEPTPLRVALLELLFEVDPDHEGGGQAVRDLLPDGLEPFEPYVPADWLAVAETVQYTSLEMVDLSLDSWAAGRVQKRARKWRDDLVGLESDNLLILCPPAQPGSIAKCISLGELVCELLAEMTAEGQQVRDLKDEKLVIELYESRDEYIAKAGENGGNPGLAFSAGHYTPAENVTRMYLPEDDNGLEEVMRTFAHEATHHWLTARCTLWDEADDIMQRASQQEGFWIIEGFASFMEDFTYDLEARTWSSSPENSSNLDSIARATATQVVPWEDQLTMPHAKFLFLRTDDKFTMLPRSQYLGPGHSFSQTNFFYAQGAAICHYLWAAEDGKYKGDLIAYLTQYYRTRKAHDLEKLTGLEHKKLGEAIHAWCRSVASLRD